MLNNNIDKVNLEETMNRSSGVLMHISSLPGKYGIGTFGREARAFADFLREARQQYWQILPLGPTSYGDSPYQSPSAFAINPHFIDLDLLCEEGLLQPEDYQFINFGDDLSKVDYNLISVNKDAVLRKAYAAGAAGMSADIRIFTELHQQWLPDYALFMAVKSHFQFREWRFWEEDIKKRVPEAMSYYSENYGEEIKYHQFLQYIAYKQWNSLKDYIHRQGIQIIGDIPIYTSGDSADTWANASAGIFKYDQDLTPLCVAGCPPDYFSEDGQYWGNTVYDWEKNKATGFQWWIRRLESALTIYDWVRIDHFRGLESYWEVPYGSPSAACGSWKPGPGSEFIDTIKNALGDVKIIAEDLGMMTDSVREFVKKSGFPNMKVLGFAFDSCGDNDHLPHHYDKNCVVYTGTHDNDTVMGWFDKAGDDAAAFAKEYLKLDQEEGYHWGMIRGALSSVANLAVIPMQDLLELGSEARMNIPSTLGGNNWRWRMTWEAVPQELTGKLEKLTRLYGR
jgi:4-alpha-glucanotransferase